MDIESNQKNSTSERKLAAILFADIQGYTALMQRDEAGASTLLKRFQSELVQEVRSHNGHVVQFYGDGALCTFNNPLEAIRCAMAFQLAFLQDPVVPVRTGIHLGTIVFEDGMAYGDSINIASRIESLGIPGSILISKRVRDELKNQPDFQMQSVGQFNFKNVEEPIEVFALTNRGLLIPNKKHMTGKLRSSSPRPKIKWPVFLIVGLLLVAAVSWIVYNSRTGSTDVPEDSEFVLQKLAVLPFSNLREDPESDFLGLALTDEIIGDLNYVKDILVRPSSAVRKYAKTTVDAPTAGGELKVDYILFGNYMREGSVIQMDIELVGVKSNELVWREEFEEEFQNAFQLQDIVSEKVLQGLKVRFSEKESQRRKADISEDPLAYEYYLRALAQPTTQEGNQIAANLLDKSIELDSLFAPTWSELGWRTKQLAAFTLGEGNQISKAEQLLQKALNLNGELLSALSYLAAIYVETGRTDMAVETARQALAINPNSAGNHFVLGYAYRYAGFLEEEEREQEIAMALDPDNLRFHLTGGLTQIYLGKLIQALKMFEFNSEHPYSLAWQGQIHLRLGDEERALSSFDKVIEMDQQGVGNWASIMKSYLEGKPEEGLQVLQKLEENLVDAEQFYNIANLYGLLGYKEQCIRTLRKAVSGGFFCYPVLQNDSFLDPVRNEPEFQELLEEAKVKHEAFGRRYF